MGLPNIAEQPSIWIVYANSPDDSMELAAQTISEEMNLAGFSIQETIFDRLDIIPSKSDAIVLVGHGHLEGLEVAGILVSWGEVNDILTELKSQMIILLACNSPSNPDSNIFGFSGQIDAKAGALLSAWKILNSISPRIQHNIQFEASFEAQTNMENPLGTCVYFVHGYLGNDETFDRMIDSLDLTLVANYGSENILKFSYFDAYQDLTKLEVHNLEGGISTYAEDFLNRILADNHPIGTQIDIVGYSLGGLITREMLRLYRPNLQSEGIDVGRVITLGTPHNGTPMANSFLLPLGVTFLNSMFTGETWSTPVFHSVAYGATFISTLNSDPESYSNEIKWYTIAGDNLGTFVLLRSIFYCSNDGLVPTFSAGLSYAEDSIIFGTLHVDLPGNDNQSFPYIEDWLAGGIDTDNDGIIDVEELYVIGTDPYDSDTDNDGLSDGAELQEETDPLDPDTDNDNLSDGDEMQEGTDPLDSDTDNDGLLDGDEVNIHFTEPLLWSTDADILSDGQEIAWGYLPKDTNDPINAQALTYSAWQRYGTTGYVRANHYSAMDYVKVYVRYKNSMGYWTGYFYAGTDSSPYYYGDYYVSWSLLQGYVQMHVRVDAYNSGHLLLGRDYQYVTLPGSGGGGKPGGDPVPD